jgi:hypothetical protein
MRQGVITPYAVLKERTGMDHATRRSDHSFGQPERAMPKMMPGTAE